MTDYLVWPETNIIIGPNTYTLVGRFEVLAALQHAFTADIVDLQPRIRNMRQDEIARLITVAIRAAGKDIPDGEVGQAILDYLDVTSTDYLLLKGDLMMWVLLSSTPKQDREKKSRELQLIRDRMKPSASLGATTVVSPPESSVGAPKPSTEAPSGN